MKRIVPILGGIVVVVVIITAAVWEREPEPRPKPNSPPPVLTLRIHEGLASAFMPNGLSTTVGGSTDGHKSECKFQVDYSPQASPRPFVLRAAYTHTGDDKTLPEEQRGAFTLTADSEATIAVTVRVECRADFKIQLDGRDVTGPVEMAAGRHQLTITGRFIKPGS